MKKPPKWPLLLCVSKQPILFAVPEHCQQENDLRQLGVSLLRLYKFGRRANVQIMNRAPSK